MTKHGTPWISNVNGKVVLVENNYHARLLSSKAPCSVLRGSIIRNLGDNETQGKKGGVGGGGVTSVERNTGKKIYKNRVPWTVMSLNYF